MSRFYTREDGYTLRVFATMYVDWGVELTRKDKDGSVRTLHYNPSGLSLESYGFDWEDGQGNPLDEGTPWSDERWREALEEELGVFVELYGDS